MEAPGEYDGVENDEIFNDCVVDDSLDPLNRLAKYCTTDFALQRITLVRDLTWTCECAGYQESAKGVLPLLSDFARDVDPGVRQELGRVLPSVAKYFVDNGGDEGYQFLLRMFLPVGFELLVDKNEEVETLALLMIQELANHVRDDDVDEHLLSVVNTLAHDERAEDYRVVAAKLFNLLAFKFKLPFCVQQVIPELQLLSQDSSFSVRNAVATHLSGVAEVVSGDPELDSVLGILFNLCRDEVWGVRQACVGAFEKISLAIPDERERALKLIEPYKELLGDASNWVRANAFYRLGYFLYTLRSEDILPEFLNMYLDMAYHEEGEDEQLLQSCAYTFPAVLKAIGPERWPNVQDAYVAMLKSSDWMARRSLSFSLHEVAAMLGSKWTEEFLISAVDALLHDVDEVRRGVVSNISKILELVSMPVRETVVPTLCRVPVVSENWRLRHEVAQRIGSVGILLDPESETFNSTVRLVSRLLDDSVARVRVSTGKSAAIMLKFMSERIVGNLDALLKPIIDLANAPSYQGRQMYVRVVQCTAREGADYLVQSSLLDGLVQLSQDRVMNVRLVVEDAINKVFLSSPKWKDNPKIQLCVKLLNEMKEEGGNKQAKEKSEQENADDYVEKL